MKSEEPVIIKIKEIKEFFTNLLKKNLSKDEENLLNNISNNLKALEITIEHLVELIPPNELNKLISQAKKNVLENAISVAKADDIISNNEQNLLEKLTQELEELEIKLSDIMGVNDFENWFVFKIVIWVEEIENYNDLLSLLDKTYCSTKIIPNSGICIGTKHYSLFNDKSKTSNRVTLLIFTLDSRSSPTREEWIRKNAFKTFNFSFDNQLFSNELKDTAQNLMDTFYERKINIE
jgi:hypothetical protein